MVNVAVPADAVPGFTYARFRCSATGGLAPTGLALSGEVEDYRVRIEGLDLGDAPDSYGTLSASAGATHGVDPELPLYLGSCVDTELDASSPLDATGDDDDLGLSTVGACLDDEDGVLLTSPLFPGETASVRVTSSLGSASLDGWIDFAADGSWMEAGDQVLTAEPLDAGSNSLTVSVPPAALSGTTSFARFRISSAGGLAPSGAAADGEVEDYAVTVLSPNGGPDSFGYTYAHSASGTRNPAFQDISSSGTELTLSGTDDGAATDGLMFACNTQGAAATDSAVAFIHPTGVPVSLLSFTAE